MELRDEHRGGAGKTSWFPILLAGNDVVVAIRTPQEDEESLEEAPRVPQGRLRGTDAQTPQDVLVLGL